MVSTPFFSIGTFFINPLGSISPTFYACLFLLRKFHAKLFLCLFAQEYWHNCANKMLVKLTPGRRCKYAIAKSWLQKMVFYFINRFVPNPISSRSYSVFYQFRQAKFAYGGSILSSSQFSLMS